ncbi:PIN domain-containing protein [Candidatus Woesearchaeota archaeon]|nr:PIN domain-containing protein [Candidatus Woesearchaeota archaeon]
MKVLVDTNRIIAALVKAGRTRDILFDEHFEFFTPDYTLTEIREHESELLKKTKLTHQEFEILLTLIFERITIIPRSAYDEFIHACKTEMSDPDDVPFLAACLAINAQGIWSHDPHFHEQHKAKVFTNVDLLRMSGKVRI